MNQTSAAIEKDIQSRRQALRDNFDEIKERVEAATDFTKLFERHTGKIVVGAIGAGALIAILSKKQVQTQDQQLPADQRRTPEELLSSRSQARNGVRRRVLSSLKEVVMAVAMAQTERFIDAVVVWSKKEAQSSMTAASSSGAPKRQGETC